MILKRDVVQYFSFNLSVYGWVHGADNCFNNTGSGEWCVRLPFFDTRSIFIIRNTSNNSKTVATIAQNTFNDCVHFCIKGESTKARCEFLSKLIVPGNISTRGDWRYMNARTAIRSETYNNALLRVKDRKMNRLHILINWIINKRIHLQLINKIF